MTDRTESCTPEERRFLDMMQQGRLAAASANDHSASIALDYTVTTITKNRPPSAHQLITALYAARGDRD